MKQVKVINVNVDYIEFTGGLKLHSEHEQDCCENHYLDLSNLNISDFEGLKFDLSSEDFFERIEDYGIALIPIIGHPVRIPGYGSNNGYYSSNLDLVLSDNAGVIKVFDISECQDISY